MQQVAINSTISNLTLMDAARDLYVRSGMSEVDYQAGTKEKHLKIQ